MKFKNWLEEQEFNEVGTCTASVAVFSRPMGGMFSRIWPPFMTLQMEPLVSKKKKKKKKNKKSS